MGQFDLFVSSLFAILLDFLFLYWVNFLKFDSPLEEEKNVKKGKQRG